MDVMFEIERRLFEAQESNGQKQDLCNLITGLISNNGLLVQHRVIELLQGLVEG